MASILRTPTRFYSEPGLDRLECGTGLVDMGARVSELLITGVAPVDCHRLAKGAQRSGIDATSGRDSGYDGASLA